MALKMAGELPRLTNIVWRESYVHTRSCAGGKLLFVDHGLANGMHSLHIHHTSFDRGHQEHLVFLDTFVDHNKVVLDSA